MTPYVIMRYNYKGRYASFYTIHYNVPYVIKGSVNSQNLAAGHLPHYNVCGSYTHVWHYKALRPRKWP